VNIETTAINALLMTTDKAVPGPADAQLNIPNTMLPVHEPILPLSMLLDRTFPAQESIFIQDGINKTNPDAASSTLLCTLGKGLWTIDLVTSSGMIGAAGIYNPLAYTVTFFYQSILYWLMAEPTFSNLAVQAKVTQRKVRVLIREQAAITLFWDAPAVGERIAVDVSLLCTKHL